MKTPKKRVPIRRSPRIQVTLSQEAMHMLDRVAKATGQGKSTLVSELVDAALPALDTTISALEIVQQQPREAQRLMQNYANNALGQLAQVQLDLDTAITNDKGKRRKKVAPEVLTKQAMLAFKKGGRRGPT